MTPATIRRLLKHRHPFPSIARSKEMAREREEFTPPVRIHPSGSHLVIYRREGQGVEIIRILHTHQDLMAYLNDG